MTLYLTTVKNSKLIDSVCDELGIVVDKSNDCENLQQYATSKLSNGNFCEVLIIDLKTLKSDNQSTMAGIDIIRRFQDCKIVIIAKGYANNDEIIFALKSKKCDLIIVEDEDEYICLQLKDFFLGQVQTAYEVTTHHLKNNEHQKLKPEKIVAEAIKINPIPEYKMQDDYSNQEINSKVYKKDLKADSKTETPIYSNKFNSESEELSIPINQMYTPPISPQKQQVYREIPQPPKIIEPPINAQMPAEIPLNTFAHHSTEIIKDKKIKHKIIVTVFGSEKRIGTTTQALQIAYYLKYLGYKCCYIQADGSNKIQKITKFYNISSNNDIGLIQFNGIDIYYKFDLAYITSLSYDCFIFDYGIFSDEHMQSALLSDFKIMVCGSKAWEEENLVEVFKKTNKIVEMYFLFSFTDYESQQQIKYLMSSHGSRTYFSNYTPNPFINNGENFAVYENIFKNIEQEDIKVIDRKKTGLLRRFFK